MGRYRRGGEAVIAKPNSLANSTTGEETSTSLDDGPAVGTRQSKVHLHFATPCVV